MLHSTKASWCGFALVFLATGTGQRGSPESALHRWLDQPPNGAFQIEYQIRYEWPDEETLQASIAHGRRLLAECFVDHYFNEQGLKMRRIAPQAENFVPGVLQSVSASLRLGVANPFRTSIDLRIDWPYWRHERTRQSPEGDTFTTTVTWDTEGFSAIEALNGVMRSQTRLKPLQDQRQRAQSGLYPFMKTRDATFALIEIAHRDGTLTEVEGGLHFDVDLTDSSVCQPLAQRVLLPTCFGTYPGHAKGEFAVEGSGASYLLSWTDCSGALYHDTLVEWADPSSFPNITEVQYVPGVGIPLKTKTLSSMHREGPWGVEDIAFVPVPGHELRDRRFGKSISYEVGEDGEMIEDSALFARLEGAILDAVDQSVFLVHGHQSGSSRLPISLVLLPLLVGAGITGWSLLRKRGAA